LKPVKVNQILIKSGPMTNVSWLVSIKDWDFQLFPYPIKFINKINECKWYLWISSLTETSGVNRVGQ